MHPVTNTTIIRQRFSTMTIDQPVALITGGSAGLGLVTAKVFLDAGFRVTIVGRDQTRLDLAADQLTDDHDRLLALKADLTDKNSVERTFSESIQRFGRLDALVNCVGGSDRGLTENLEVKTLEQLIHQNVSTALLCSQAALPELEKTRGVIVNVGSLASKVGARYIGGYSAAKHALAGMTQQMRLELKPRGVHVALVNPGPIKREDAGNRYSDKVDQSVPDQASKPGGGTRVKGLEPERVARAILSCVQKRRIDVVLPSYMRLLIALGHAWPALGDWLLLKFTSSKNS